MTRTLPAALSAAALALVLSACSARAEKAALPATPGGTPARAVRVATPSARVETGLSKATGTIRSARLSIQDDRRTEPYVKVSGFRKNNLAAAMTVLLGVSLQVVKQIEIPDAESQEFMRGLNDQLAALSAFSSMSPEKRTQVYDTMVIVGGLIAGIAQNAAETRNREMAALALQMAKDSLAQFGVKS